MSPSRTPPEAAGGFAAKSEAKSEKEANAALQSRKAEKLR